MSEITLNFTKKERKEELKFIIAGISILKESAEDKYKKALKKQQEKEELMKALKSELKSLTKDNKGVRIKIGNISEDSKKRIGEINIEMEDIEIDLNLAKNNLILARRELSSIDSDIKDRVSKYKAELKAL